MQPTTNDPRYLMTITEDAETGEYVILLPALGLSQHGTFDEVSAWALEQLAQQEGLAPTSEDNNQVHAQDGVITQ